MILSRVSNPLKDNYLVRGALCVVSALAAACGGTSPEAAKPPIPQAATPLPVTNLAGQRVLVLPFTLIAADDALGWQGALADRRAALAHADSVFGALLQERATEVNWALPPELRRAAQLSAGMVGDPGQFPSAMLRFETLTDVPDPLRSQLRNLAAVGGGRYALVPAALVFVRTDTAAVRAGGVTGQGPATAELTLVLVDTRLGKVGWRTVARGAAEAPWAALTRATKAVTPGLP